MNLYEVEISVMVVVIGENEQDALDNAEEDVREIKSDSEFAMQVIKEVTTETLPNGWDGGCIPYGGDGNVRINNIK